MRSIAEKLMAAGRPASDPVAVVCNAALPEQFVVEGTLGDVAALEPMIAPPAIVVRGPVSRFRKSLDWYVGALRESAIG